MNNIQAIQADFDDLALLPAETWDHNSHYHKFLLRHLPSPCGESLEIGCGTGAFSRLLAERSRAVVAMDLSPNMVHIARRESASYSNIEFRVADVMETELGAERFDCIASVATLHHLPTEKALAKLKQALKVNGVLLILDLFEEAGVLDAFRGAVALPASMALRLINDGRLVASKESRDAWARHGLNDSYPTLNEVRKMCEDHLPRARIRKHLFWRYSVVWKKTG